MTGFSGERGGLKTWQWIVTAKNKTEARRSIRQSSLGRDSWLDEPIRGLTATSCEDIPDILLENVRRV